MCGYFKIPYKSRALKRDLLAKVSELVKELWLSAAKMISFCNFPAQEFECMVCCPKSYDKLRVLHWSDYLNIVTITVETDYEVFYKMKLQNEWGTFIDLKILPVSYLFLWCRPRYLGDPIRRNGGIHGILLNTEYSKTRNIQNILYLIWTGLTKKQRQRILGCFEI